MGQKQSKDQLVYQMVINGDVHAIRTLYSQGAGLEWKDKERKTALIMAAKDPTLYGVAKLLIDLGANVNALSRGRQGGTPLHYAAKEGLNHTVALLLSHGANAFVKNDNHETPLAVARKNKRSIVVQEIENHICYFAGHIRETCGPGFSDTSTPQLSSRVIWVVVVPCSPTNPPKPPKLELVIYSTPQDSEARKILLLRNCKIKEPKFDQPNPSLMIVDKDTKTRYKFSSVTSDDKQQLRRLYNACKGISQAAPVLAQTGSNLLLSPIKTMQTNASPWSSPIMSRTNLSTHATGSLSPNPWLSNQSPRAEHNDFGLTQTWTPPNQLPRAEHNGFGLTQTWTPPNQSPLITKNSTTIPIIPIPQSPKTAISPPPSAPPVTPDLDLSIPASTSLSTHANERSEVESTTCVICWDAPTEGACIPCGHVVGCMSCLQELNDNKEVCPICRSDIHQVVKLYGV